MLVVVGNAAWTLASIALLFSGGVSPNLLGEVVVVAQAIATGVFAELQYIGMRKSGGAVTASARQRAFAQESDEAIHAYKRRRGLFRFGSQDGRLSSTQHQRRNHPHRVSTSPITSIGTRLLPE